MFFVFQEMKVFNPKLKNSCFVFRRTPSGFSLLFLKMFHFTIDFYYCFRVFSLLIAFIHFSFFFAMTFFIRYFVFVLLYRESYGRFLLYTPSRHLVQRWLLQQHNCTNLLPWPQAVPL